MREPPAWCRDYIGLPFAHHGRTRAGLDCWGLYRLIVGERLDVWLPSYAELYRDADDGGTIEHEIEANAVRGVEYNAIDPGDERPFDAVQLWSYYETDDGLKRAGFHVGCVVAPSILLHVEIGINASWIDYKNNIRIKSRVAAFWRPAVLA